MRTPARNLSAGKPGRTSDVNEAAGGVQEEVRRDRKRRACAKGRKKKEVSMVNDLLKSIMDQYVDHSPASPNPNIDAPAQQAPQDHQANQAHGSPMPASSTSPDPETCSVSFLDPMKDLSSRSVSDVDHQPQKISSRKRSSVSPATIPTKQQVWLIAAERLREDVIKARHIHQAGCKEKVGPQYVAASGDAIRTDYDTRNFDASRQCSPCDLCKGEASAFPRQEYRPAMAITVCEHHLCWQCLCQWHQKDSVAPGKKQCPWCKRILAKSQVTFLGDIQEPVNMSHGGSAATISPSSGTSARPPFPSNSSIISSRAAVPDRLIPRRSLSTTSQGRVISHHYRPDEYYKSLYMQEYEDKNITISSPISETGRQSFPDIPSCDSMDGFPSFPSQTGLQRDALLNGSALVNGNASVQSAAASFEIALGPLAGTTGICPSLYNLNQVGPLGTTGICSSQHNLDQVDSKLIFNYQASVGPTIDTVTSVDASATTCPNQGLSFTEPSLIHPVAAEIWDSTSRHNDGRIQMDAEPDMHEEMDRDYLSRLLEKNESDVSSTNPLEMEVLHNVMGTVNLDDVLENPFQFSWLSMLLASLQNADRPTNGQQMTQSSVVNQGGELSLQVDQSVAAATLPALGIPVAPTLQQEDMPITVSSIIQPSIYPSEAKGAQVMDMGDICCTLPLPTTAALAHQDIGGLSTETDQALNMMRPGSHVSSADDACSSQARRSNQTLDYKGKPVLLPTTGHLSSTNHHTGSESDWVFEETWDWTVEEGIFTLLGDVQPEAKGAGF